MTTHASSQVHDIIKLTTPLRQGIIEKVTELSASGRSQREIALELKTSKSWVQGALTKKQKDLERQTKVPNPPTKRAFGRRPGSAPFGFVYLEGRLVEDPREVNAIQKIVALWNTGRGPKAIAAELNRLKILTRKGRKWDHSVVSEIISRTHNRTAPYDRFGSGFRAYVARKSPVNHQNNGKKE